MRQGQEMIGPWIMQRGSRDIYGSHPDPRRNQLRSELLWGYLPGTKGLVWGVGWWVELQSNCLWLRQSQECKSQHRCHSGCCGCLAQIPMHFFLFLWFFSYRGQTHHQRTTIFSEIQQAQRAGCVLTGTAGTEDRSPTRQPASRDISGIRSCYGARRSDFPLDFCLKPTLITFTYYPSCFCHLLPGLPEEHFLSKSVRCESLFQGPFQRTITQYRS